jgi:hypothetical protein
MGYDQHYVLRRGVIKIVDLDVTIHPRVNPTDARAPVVKHAALDSVSPIRHDKP